LGDAKIVTDPLDRPPRREVRMRQAERPIVQTQWPLTPYYVGDDSDGAYYQVAKGRKRLVCDGLGRRSLGQAI